MRIVVTGSRGFIGHHTVNHLRNAGHTVVEVDIVIDPKMDIRKTEVVEYFRGADAVVHLAAIPGVQTSVDKPELTQSTNVNGTKNVISICETLGIRRLIYASSSSVYPDMDEKAVEMGPIGPKSPYGATKVQNELDARASSIDVTMGLRFFTVYGREGRNDMAYAIFTNAIANDKLVTITGPNTSRDFTHIDTVTDVIGKLLEKNMPGHHVFNVCSGETHTLFHMATIIGNTLLKPLRIQYTELPKWSAASTHGDNSKLRELVEMKIVPFAEGIADYVKWYTKAV